MFGQLSNRESLRDLIVALEAHHSKCNHLGMGKNVSKSSLAYVSNAGIVDRKLRRVRSLRICTRDACDT